MVRLADTRWSVPKIARQIGQYEQTVRAWIKAFLDEGIAALANKPQGGKESALTRAILDAVRAEVAKAERTWTAAQLTDWVAKRCSGATKRSFGIFTAKIRQWRCVAVVSAY